MHGPYCIDMYVLYSASMGRRPRFEPLPMCFDCLTPDIGIDLTTSYATVAIHYHDGTVENLAKVGSIFLYECGRGSG